MKTIYLERKRGKTTQILQEAANFNGTIVCVDPKITKDQADLMGVSINYPISHMDFIHGRYSTYDKTKFLIDDVDLLLAAMTRKVPIDCISLSKDVE